ncbi:hypothetical protein M0R45_006219 [Rubus argutus]|uniref:C3H1-type domain-containing protein n=1 Tax=Rubus argutus TaxID=59490 RepID=A0AAW1YPX3_RUBAR
MVPIPHFCSSAPKCNLLASSTERVDSAEGEKCLIVAVYLDSKAELLSQTKRLALAAGSEPLVDRVTASKLLHVCCNLDSAECASALLGGGLGAIPLVNELDDSGKSPLHTAAAAHAARCVEVLLEEDARTDLTTKDGQAQLALELSLCDKRIDVNWNLNDFSIEDLVIHMSEKDLSTVRLLCDKTKEIAEVAYSYAIQGRVAAFTALLIVAAEKVNVSVLELRDSESDSKEKVTIYECLLFGAVGHSGGADKKVTTPLIRAAREGDEAVIWLLLKTNIDVIDADADGNSALHWILRLLRLLCPQQIKILSLLLEHGARVSQRTACHIAAGNGNSVALEVLLLQDPDGVHEIFNLCGQGAIDLATSQDMCYILLNPTTVSLIKHAFPSQDKCTALELTDEDTTTESTKAEICKYLDSHRGCVGGAKCFYAHCEEESWKVKEGADWSHYPAAKQLKRKIFVGELPSSVDSDVLGKFFEEEFGSVEDAIVIVTQQKTSGDLKCLPDLSIGDGDESKCIQDLSADDGGDSKCVQNLSVDGSSDTNCLHNLSADNAVDSKYHQDISIFNASENYNLNATSYVEEKPSCVYQEKKNCAENKSHCVHSGQLHGQKEIDMLAGETDNGSIEDNNMSKSYFIRESDFCMATFGLRMGRSADAKSFEFFIAGLQSGTPTCYHLVYENEKNKKLDKIEMCKVVGSGSSFADIVFSPNWKGYGNNVSLEEAIQRACWALLIAALWDKHTGGILTGSSLPYDTSLVH